MRRKPCCWTRWTGPFLRPCWVIIVVWKLSPHLRIFIVFVHPCLNSLFMCCSWPLCIGVHQGENCRPLLDGPIGWRAGAAAPHPQQPLPAGFALPTSCSRRPERKFQLEGNKPHLWLHEACTCPRSRSGSPVAAWMTAHWCGSKTTWSPFTKIQEPHSFSERTMCWCSRCVSALW